MREFGDTGAPLAVPAELHRPQLVERLSARWERAVTVVVAGAGFGKSTAVAQAVRRNTTDPVGLDRWIRCGPGHEQAENLARSILTALGRERTTAAPLWELVDGLDAESPLDVCLVFDDVHLLPGGSSGARLLEDLLRVLPTHAHLVLIGRSRPAIPLARLRAADAVVDVGEDELLFTDSETDRLATALARTPAPGAGYGGWPALTRLALAADRRLAIDYIQEEILAGLTQTERRQLIALASFGSADDRVVSKIIDGPADLAELATRVPLVSDEGGGRHRAHDLWREALPSHFDPVETRELRLRCIDLLMEEEELAAAGALAIQASDWESLARTSLQLVGSTVSVLPLDIARGWLAAVPVGRRSEPEFELLAATVDGSDDFNDPSVDARIDRVVSRFTSLGQSQAVLHALAVGTVVAQSRGDQARLFELAMQALEVEGADSDPITRFTARAIAGVLAERAGDPESAVEKFAESPVDSVPPASRLAADRFLWHCLVLAGRADEAVDLAERRSASGEYRRWNETLAVGRWMSGDPGDFLSNPELAGARTTASDVSARDVFVWAALITVIEAGLGRRTEHLLIGTRWRAPAPLPDNARDAALITNALAARALLDGDETAAAACYSRYLARYPVTDRFGERHLRRFLAIGYVLSDQLRACWDDAALGPSHQRVRAAANALVQCRRGNPADFGDLTPPSVATALPLPWSVELACRAISAGAGEGRVLASWLVDHVGDAARRQLRLLSRQTTGLGLAASSLLAELPVEPSSRLRINVLGPLEVYGPDDERRRPELRRARVRELLSLLVLEGSVSRERASDLLWSGLDRAAATRNLRVTLSYLRRLLEPERTKGEAAFTLRADRTQITLFRSDHLIVDFWEFERLVDEAARARSSGEGTKTIELLEEATALRRGSPFPDLQDIDAVAGRLVRADQTHLDLLIELGELDLARGRSSPAHAAAQKALVIDPYREQAHRLALAGSLQLGDPALIARAVEQLRHFFEDTGVTPTDATQILLNRAAKSAPVATS